MNRRRLHEWWRRHDGGRLWLPTAMLVVALAALLVPPLVDVWTPPPLTFRELRVTSPAHPGEAMTVEVSRCNTTRRALVAVVSTTVVNRDTGLVTRFPPVETVIATGCATGFNRTLVLPADLSPGWYQPRLVVEIDDRGRTWRVPAQGDLFVVR